MKIIHCLCISGLLCAGRGTSLAQQPGDKLWEFETGGPITSSAAIAPDGSIYIGSRDAKLYAMDPRGRKLWDFATGGEINSSPTVDAATGAIYFGSGDGKLYALNPDGTKKWEFALGAWTDASPALGRDGTIYMGSSGGLFVALRPDGTEKWRVQGGDWLLSAGSIGHHDTIYIAFGADFPYAYALSPGGAVLWQSYASSELPSPIAIGHQGTLFFGAGPLIARNANGQDRWTFPLDHRFQSGPAVGPHGTIYISTGDFKLYAVRSNGTKEWELIYGEPFPLDQGAFIFSTPAVAQDGTIYLGSRAGKNLLAVKPGGTLAWEFQTGGAVLSSPVIGRRGVIYFGSGDHKLYAVQGSAPLAHSAWPMFRHDPQGTGNIRHQRKY